jgi:hypothetical protein
MITNVDYTHTIASTIKNKISTAGDAVKNFIISTPPEVIVSTVAGFAIQFFEARLALPFYGVIIGSTLSRLTMYIIEKTNKHAACKIITTALKFHAKLSFIPLILLIGATVLAWFIPPAGFVAGIVIGLYYGPIAESNRNNQQQNITGLSETQPLGL